MNIKRLNSLTESIFVLLKTFQKVMYENIKIFSKENIQFSFEYLTNETIPHEFTQQYSFFAKVTTQVLKKCQHTEHNLIKSI